jgi:hypothetical protein
METLQVVSDSTKAMLSLVNVLYEALRNSKAEALIAMADNVFWSTVTALHSFNSLSVKVLLTELCKKLDKGLVIFFDEADTLADRALISFLSQLRDGYVNRAKVPFPRSIALVGLRDIRDYKVRIRPEAKSLGSSSPFNIITDTLTLPNFTLDEIRVLYSQHTEATGQAFTDEARPSAWYWSEGQPWLVNALARQAVDKILAGDYGQAVTASHIDEAADILMRRRDTHIDSLLARLQEPRVRRFIEPMLALSNEDAINTQSGESLDSLNDDLQYCLDLGLLKKDDLLRPANPIYASVISRFVSQHVQEKLPKDLIGK